MPFLFNSNWHLNSRVNICVLLEMYRAITPEKVAVSSRLQVPVCHVSLLRFCVGRRGRVRESERGMWGRCFWGWQRLDESYLHSALCKMPCVNICPWPKHSDLAKQTLRSCLSVLSGCKRCGLCLNLKSGNEEGKHPEGRIRWFAWGNLWAVFSHVYRADGACCGKSRIGVKAGSGRSK